MRFLGRRGSIASVVVGLTCVVATLAWAGGSGFGDDDDAGEDEGPPYFGFVKDANGSTLPDSKVTVSVKDRGGVVTRTDALGAYKVPGLLAERAKRTARPFRPRQLGRGRADGRRAGQRATRRLADHHYCRQRRRWPLQLSGGEARGRALRIAHPRGWL